MGRTDVLVTSILDEETRMMLTLTALMKTVTGKAIAGLVVATTSVGAAAAAGADVPVLTTVISSDDDASEEGGESADDDGVADESSGEVSDGEIELGLVATESDADDADGEDATHGAVVSEFTQSVEELYGLTGCAKGQATAAVARGDVDPESETIEDDLVEFIERCPNDGADEEVGENEESELAAEVEVLDPKSVHEDGKAAFHEAQAEYDAECGDDEDSENGENGENGEDDPMSELCRELKEAAKAAHADWKNATREARESEQAERRSAAADRPDKSGQQGQGKANGKNKDG